MIGMSGSLADEMAKQTCNSRKPQSQAIQEDVETTMAWIYY